MTSPPRLTITVFERGTNTPAPPPRTVARAVLQPPPEPSPTPNVYIIQENDTLLDIAIRLDVPLDDLLLANPDIDPSVLQIGQEITIPVAGADIDSANIPVAEIDLRAPQCTVTSTSGVVCLGTVVNTLDRPIQQVSIEVQLLDANDRPLATAQSLIEQAYILPGALAPYRVLFTEIDSDDVYRVTAMQISGFVTDTLEQRFTALEVKDATLFLEDDAYRFTATLLNANEVTVERPRAVVTLLDDEQRPYAYRIWGGETSLVPNEEVTVQIPILPVPMRDLPPMLTYQLHTEARLPVE